MDNDSEHMSDDLKWFCRFDDTLKRIRNDQGHPEEWEVQNGYQAKPGLWYVTAYEAADMHEFVSGVGHTLAEASINAMGRIEEALEAWGWTIEEDDDL